MNVRVFTLLLCLLFVSTAGSGQDGKGTGLTIKGSVADSTGKPVAYANVNLRNKAGDAIVAYTNADSGGEYLLKFPAHRPGEIYYLDARCIGYVTQIKTVKLAGTESEVISFTLKTAYHELDAVEVKGRHKLLLRTRGDTISYKAADFTSEQDRVIGDVIKRLPGISVAEDGTISYNNRPISGIYIAGDNLLDDKYSIAANTIPNGVVDQVQVIDNHQPIKVLQNKLSSNEVALNLVFTKAKLRLLGQETLGAGIRNNDGAYEADINALLLKDKYKAINYLKANNTGEDLQRDLVSHNDAGNQNRTGDEPVAALLSLGTINNPNLARQRYLFNQASALSVNDLINFKNGLQLRVNAAYLRDKQEQVYSQQTSIYLPGDTIRYIETQANQFNPSVLHARFTLNVNTNKYYLNNAFTLNDNRSTNFSNLNTNGSLLHQLLTNHSTGFSNEFNLVSSIKSKNIIEAYTYTSHLAKSELLKIGPGYSDSIFNHGVPYQQLMQAANVPTWFSNNYVSLKIPGKYGTTGFKTGFSVQSQSLSSSLSVLQTNNTLDAAFGGAVNHSNWNQKKIFAEAAFDFPSGKLTGNLTVPFTLQQINYEDTVYGLHNRLKHFYVNPQGWLKYKTSVENFLTLQYSYRNNSGGIEDIYPGSLLNNYRVLNAGSAALTLQQIHQVSSGFNYRKSLALFFASCYISYNHTRANAIASYIINNNLQEVVVLAYPNSGHSWTATGTMGKYSFAWHTSFSASAQWQQTQYVQLQNKLLTPFTTLSKTLEFSADTKFSKKLSSSYHVTGTLTGTHDTRLPPAGSAVHLAQVQQQGSLDYNPSLSLQFRLAGDYYITRREGNDDLKYCFMDIRAKYKIKKWKTDLQLAGTNLLNVKTYNTFYLSTNMLSASSYQLPGRNILLKLLFNL